jgi:hypothetical protein
MIASEAQNSYEISSDSKTFLPTPAKLSIGYGRFGIIWKLSDSEAMKEAWLNDKLSQRQLKNEIEVLLHLKKHKNENIVELINSFEPVN